MAVKPKAMKWRVTFKPLTKLITNHNTKHITLYIFELEFKIKLAGAFFFIVTLIV